jgi:hypothetical protein
MAAVTRNRSFFNCPLLLYYKSSDGKSSPGLWPRELKTLQRKSHAGCGDLKVK